MTRETETRVELYAWNLLASPELSRGERRPPASLNMAPFAVAARYRAGTIIVELSSGFEIRFPVRLAQGLEQATPKELADIKIEAWGLGLHWPKLDVDLYVPSLVQGVLGTKRWMAEIGKLGGSVTSPAKARATAEKGKLDGRPKKVPVEG